MSEVAKDEVAAPEIVSSEEVVPEVAPDLRQRNTKTEDSEEQVNTKTPDALEAEAKDEKVRTKKENQEILSDALIEKLPVSVQKYARMVFPILLNIGHLLNILGPYAIMAYEKAKEVYVKLEPYHPFLLLEMFSGLVLIFFGGFFALTIAAVEAFRIAGWSEFVVAAKEIRKNYHQFIEANVKDDEEDLDGDGISDSLQISKTQLVTRKMKLFMLNTDPEELSDALTCLYTGFLGVLAALRLQFARTIALGATIGQVLEKPANKYATPLLKKMFPEEYHSWITVGTRYVTRTIGCSVAWFLQRIISAVHAAIRGSTLFCNGFAAWMKKHGHNSLAEGYFDEVFAGVCCLFGLYFQLTSFFLLPWYMSLLLFPLVALEFSLTLILSWSA
jgi:hypothetical protein